MLTRREELPPILRFLPFRKMLESGGCCPLSVFTHTLSQSVNIYARVCVCGGGGGGRGGGDGGKLQALVLMPENDDRRGVCLLF